MEEILGTTLLVFFGVTVVILGAAAFMTGQAMAGTWRPVWQTVAYCLLLAAVSRFFIYALYDGRLLFLPGFIADAVVLVSIGLFSYRVTRVRMMTAQYPWLYERRGLLGYRDKAGG